MAQNANVVKVVTGYGSCTGTLVDAQWIATAASCFSQNPANYSALTESAPGLNARAMFGSNTNVQTAVAITWIKPFKGLDDKADDPRDLVLAKLATPAFNTSPMKLATTAPATGAQLNFIGWGRTATEWMPKTAKNGTFKVSSIDAKEITILGTPTPPSSESPSLCLGDSGAPGIRTTPNGQELTALNSRSWQKTASDPDKPKTAPTQPASTTSPPGSKTPSTTAKS
ncbi:trypsin-like serine protease [Renibacterium salmoninarum]|nr:trypsin-like serine protease [Renibacterium salmoninarum]